MAARKQPLANISTQYARNGSLLEESLEYLRLVARGVSRAERRELLVLQNGLRRQTYKARRNIFEALEARFQNEHRAADLGLLTLMSAPGNALSLGIFLEIARHDALIGRFLSFIVGHIGSPWDSIDAKLFLRVLEQETGAVSKWAPTLQRRAIAALNAIPAKFQIWTAQRGAVVSPIEVPVELAAIILQEQAMNKKSPLQANDFRVLGVESRDIINLAWACARRHWFNVDAVGDIVRLEPRYGDVASMFGIHGFGACA